MSTVDHLGVLPGQLPKELASSADERTLAILAHRRSRGFGRRRGWLVRRMLVVADVVGLSLAFVLTYAFTGSGSGQLDTRVGGWLEAVALFGSLPAWIAGAKLFGLYDRDEERTDHSTVDDLVRVFLLVTVGAFLLTRLGWLTGFFDPDIAKLTLFWALAVLFVTIARSAARTVSRRSIAYLQNTIIVGAGEVGQLVARKLLQHPEYGLNLVGFVDAHPRERRSDLEHLTVLGPPDRLLELARAFDVERVIIAFSNDGHAETLELARSLRDFDVQVDVIPRLFELVGPSVDLHTLEGMPLLALKPVRPGRAQRVLKRSLDLAGASIGLVLTAPLLAYVAIRIKLDSPGPILFRQTRLGHNMREIELLKFRTMKVGTSAHEHRDFIKATMTPGWTPQVNGLFKLEREGSVTKVGRWLRRTSLDELPQLINVLRGEMSLVGPRPCLAYETEDFAPHHFERFSVPAGLTGLWQVTARAHATFGEALDMDVAYARNCSLGLDLWLLCKTPLQLLRANGTR